MTKGLIAALDVGKTHTRLALLDVATGAEVWSAQRNNRSVDSPIGRQLDIEGIESWLTEALHSCADRERIERVVPIGHGAAAVLIDHQGGILAAPDYEDPSFETVKAEYELERDPFSSTLSPSLPLGLNLGRQLFYLEGREPRLIAQLAHILPYPQFWAWRLSGVLASEVTSLGCHSDLWRPSERNFSALAVRHGWSVRFPPLRATNDELGIATGPLAVKCALPARCKIVCGIHDSNASYLRYLLGRREESFAVISSGTWTVVMANRVPIETLRPERGMLANVDAFGTPVATARFMGGREYEVIAGTTAAPTLDALHAVIARKTLALPAFAAGGPMGSVAGRLVNAEDLNVAERAALATLYTALMSDLLLELLSFRGDIIIDGPLAINPLFGQILGCLRPNSPIFIDAGSRSNGAICYLGGSPSQYRKLGQPVHALAETALCTYRDKWRRAVDTIDPSPCTSLAL